jgi:hypothetical protein
MSRPLSVLPSLVLSTILAVPAAVAQPSLNQRIGPNEFGAPIIVTTIDPQLIGAVSRAAGVPMGIEVASGAAVRADPKTLTGLTIRAALDVISAVDSRYEWREMNDVIVLRTLDAWNRPDHPLHERVQPLLLHDIRGRNALYLIAALLGAPQYQDVWFGETKPRPYPMPPLPAKSSGVLLERGARALGYHPQPSQMAINSQPYNGRPACQHCGFCRFFV